MTKKNEKSKSAGGKNMSKILSEKQKEVFMQARKSGKAYDLMQARMQARKSGKTYDLMPARMQARKSGKAYDLMQARKNGMHQDLADIIKKSKEDEDD